MPRVLVVDDEESLRDILTIALADFCGWEVTTAGNGQEGLSLAVQTEPDVILLDVMMPHMDGPTTLGLLRSHRTTAGIPVIFLTAKAQRSEVERLMGLGAAGVLTKPFDPLALPNQIHSLLGGAP